MPIILPNPELQVDFAAALILLRDTLLQDALFATVKTLPIDRIDHDLSQFAEPQGLSLLASKGLRGELVFATPILLRANPKLLGYYRLLLGFSQKVFYTSTTGLSGFLAMEERGTLSAKCAGVLPDLCRALNTAASYLVQAIPGTALTGNFLDDLALLTLGPQLRGGANVKKGGRGILIVFDAIKSIVEDHILESTPRVIVVENASRRLVRIEFAADPDIIIRERLQETPESFRNVVAIEVKGGTDFSNIHNRIGEAEKSHQKARARGYTECWTVVNVDRVNEDLLHRESPTTNRFYRLSQIAKAEGDEFDSFRSRVASATGTPVRALARKARRRR